MRQAILLALVLFSTVACNSTNTAVESDRPAVETGVVWNIKSPNPYPSKMVMRLLNGTVVFNSCLPRTMANVSFEENRTKLVIRGMADPAGSNVGFEIMMRDVNCSPAEYQYFFSQAVRYSFQDIGGVRYINFNLASE